MKYRIWIRDPLTDTWHMEYPPKRDVLDPIVIGLDGTVYQLWGEDLGNDAARTARRVPPEDYVLNRCTGLLDKAGVDIYMGDIVRGHERRTYLGQRSDRSGIGVVKYGLCGFIADDPYRFSEVVALHIDGQIFPPGPNDCGSTGLEVIGNVHENPDLLEATK